MGTSAGFREFCSGKLAIAAASRPINAKELKTCAAAGVRFLELPIAFDAITIVVNPRNSWAKQISTQELSNLWQKAAQQRVTTWKQVNSQWPEQPIKLCGPGRDSGTYDYFNKAINGSEDNSRRDYTASEDDAVIVNCVAKSQNALGYFGYDYYSSNPVSYNHLTPPNGLLHYVPGDPSAVTKPCNHNVQWICRTHIVKVCRSTR